MRKARIRSDSLIRVHIIKTHAQISLGFCHFLSLLPLHRIWPTMTIKLLPLLYSLSRLHRNELLQSAHTNAPTKSSCHRHIVDHYKQYAVSANKSRYYSTQFEMAIMTLDWLRQSKNNINFQTSRFDFIHEMELVQFVFSLEPIDM